jgi:hypothetical protein
MRDERERREKRDWQQNQDGRDWRKSSEFCVLS